MRFINCTLTLLVYPFLQAFKLSKEYKESKVSKALRKSKRHKAHKVFNIQMNNKN